jgi:hypothetical protein
VDVRIALDVPRLTEQVSALESRASRLHSLAVVLPIREGMREVAAEFLAEGPPFAPETLGLAGHAVFITDSEIVFLFETREGLGTLAEIAADPDFWTVVEAWEHVMADQPRIAPAIYDWRAP